MGSWREMGMKSSSNSSSSSSYSSSSSIAVIINSSRLLLSPASIPAAARDFASIKRFKRDTNGVMWRETGSLDGATHQRVKDQS